MRTWIDPEDDRLTCPGLAHAQPADLPRCFAVAENCVLHAATVPTCATWEATSPEPSKWFVAGPGHVSRSLWNVAL